MSVSKDKEGDDYVTLRVKCLKQVVVTTYGTVDVRVPRANRRRVQQSFDKESRLVEFLDGSNCVEWDASQSSLPSHLITYAKRLPDSEQAYRCRWNLNSKAWELEEAEGDGDED